MGTFRRYLRRVDTPIYKVIAQRRRAPDLEQREDILSLLLAARHEDGSPLSDCELRDGFVTLLLAGHETTATALAWAVARRLTGPVEIAGRLLAAGVAVAPSVHLVHRRPDT